MIPVSVDEARASVREHAPQARPTRVTLDKAFGRILLEAVIATRDQPPFDAAAMDGYALMAPMRDGESLSVLGESQAGRTFNGALKDGAAVRVFTGAPLPAATTRVIMQEEVERQGDTIRLRADATPAAKPHVRPRGSDFRAGDVLLQFGDRMTAWRLALAAASGAARLTVARQPKVAFVCTGDELVPPGKALRVDQTHESNSVALTALARQWGAAVLVARRVRDDSTALTAALRDARADILVTIGGASVGDYDLVRPALDALGMRWLFDQVNLKPGKPTAFGILGDGRRVLCLPGNPASALICAQLFLKPLIEAASGAQVAEHVRALPCATGLPANGPREAFLRAVILTGSDGMPLLLPLSDQDSAQLHGFAVTSALIRRRVGAPAAAPGVDCECCLCDI